MALITASLPLVVMATPATSAYAKSSDFGFFDLSDVPGEIFRWGKGSKAVIGNRANTCNLPSM